MLSSLSKQPNDAQPRAIAHFVQTTKALDDIAKGVETNLIYRVFSLKLTKLACSEFPSQNKNTLQLINSLRYKENFNEPLGAKWGQELK
jgi:hypothetical protein